MRFRQDRERTDSNEADRLERELRAVDQASGLRPAPGDPYWANLIIRTNQRLDGATSGKAISISWAARVAIPGVIAVLSFLVALHYYVPKHPAAGSTVASVIASMPASSVDSLLADPSVVDENLSLAEVSDGVLEIPPEQIADYLMASGNATQAMEDFSDRQLDEVASILAASPTNPSGEIR